MIDIFILLIIFDLVLFGVSAWKNQRWNQQKIKEINDMGNGFLYVLIGAIGWAGIVLTDIFVWKAYKKNAQFSLLILGIILFVVAIAISWLVFSHQKNKMKSIFTEFEANMVYGGHAKKIVKSVFLIGLGKWACFVMYIPLITIPLVHLMQSVVPDTPLWYTITEMRADAKRRKKMMADVEEDDDESFEEAPSNETNVPYSSDESIAFRMDTHEDAASSHENTTNSNTMTTTTGHEIVENKNTNESVNISLGDIVLFGSYEQGDGVEPVKWRILRKENNKMLLLSEYALERMPYNNAFKDVTWETCSLRKWLNNDFLNRAFSNEEKEQIIPSPISAERNPRFNINPGNDTVDKIFLLSVPEVLKYFNDAVSRLCLPTKYLQGKHNEGIRFSREGGYCRWTLRSPGNMPSGVSGVSRFDGDITYYPVIENDQAVRPAMWIQNPAKLKIVAKDQEKPVISAIDTESSSNLQEIQELSGEECALMAVSDMDKNGNIISPQVKFEILKRGCSLNDDTCMMLLGQMYMTGEYVEKDLEKAGELLLQPAQNGSLTAMSDLGHVYMETNKEGPHGWEGNYWLCEAAKQGSEEAFYNISRYIEGYPRYKLVVEKDFAGLYKKCMEHPSELDRSERHFYGMCKYYGIFCGRNTEEAKSIYRKLADEGDIKAGAMLKFLQ